MEGKKKDWQRQWQWVTQRISFTITFLPVGQSLDRQDKVLATVLSMPLMC